MNTAAKKYLSQGLIVFPVGLGYKQTADGKLKKDLQPEPGFTGLTLETARRLSFAKNGLGLLTGFGVMALDIDNVALWDHVLTTLGVPEPETCRSISQSGGRHLLFKVTPELERLRKKSVFGLKALGLDDFDLLGKGDFLLVPPSSFETPNGHREYTFVPGYSLVDNPGTLLPAPGWLIEVLTPNSALHRHVRESYLRLAFKKVDSDLDSGDTVDPDKVDSDSGVCKGEKDSVSDDFTPAEKALIDLDTEDRLKEVAKHVKKLSANRAIDRQSWIEVGMAIHHATDGHYQGMELWDQFSRRAGPYDRHTLEYQWGSFQNGSGITLGSLIHWAKEDTRVAREEKKRLKSEEEKEQEKMKADEALRREAVQFGVNHTGGEGVFEGWNAEKSVAVISNTMHHPDHRVECVVGSNGAYQKCTECAWRNPISGQLMVPRIEYPALHQQFFNITINNTVNYYNSNSVELELWDDEAHLADDYQPFDDPKLSLHFKRAFSGIDSDFGRFVYHLNFGTVVASGEDKTQWFKLNGFRWEQVGVDPSKI
ncbi:hypothetical protein HK102_002668 [Quaeritorhiza haematococci]|nr:hypothetical protein HK102_002668 [Quaeritorhiza haematococci]